MAVTGAAIAANQKAGGKPAQRVGAYIKAHWKELLALVLAAIPALFIVFHSGARKTAGQVLTLSPSTPPIGDNSSAIPPPSTSNPAPPVAAAVAAAVAAPVNAVKAVSGSARNGAVSENGSNPTKAPRIPKTGDSTAPPTHLPIRPTASTIARPIQVLPTPTSPLKRGGPVIL